MNVYGRDEPNVARLYPNIPAPDYSERPPVLDAHDVICFDMWAVILLQDATLWKELGKAQIFRQPREATYIPTYRYHQHWMKEHAQPEYPEIPV